MFAKGGIALLLLSAASSLAAIKGPQTFSTHKKVGKLAEDHVVSVAIAMPFRNETALDQFLADVYNPESSVYGQFLEAADFHARFCPTAEDVAEVAYFLGNNSLEVTHVADNNMLIHVSGPAAKINAAFQVELSLFTEQEDGAEVSYYYASELEGTLPGKAAGLIGLENRTKLRHHATQGLKNGALRKFDDAPVTRNLRSRDQRFSGTPTRIHSAYNIPTGKTQGAGQVLGLVELDGFDMSDVTFYEKYYGLPDVPIEIVNVGAKQTASGGGAVEVTLDIELMIATASGMSKLVVYTSPNTMQQSLELLTKIATDNVAKSISTSWGSPEMSLSASYKNAENSAFKQMTAQGQSFFAAAGDSGAFDSGGSKLAVDDPGSQPYVTCVGGTTLTLNPKGAWEAESTWWTSSDRVGGGGGISSYWAMPTYQKNAPGANSGASVTHRNVPDVSLDANPQTGYPIYVGGSWGGYGGTSCAAPIFAAFTAIVNQNREANGKSSIGFINPSVYAIGMSSNYDSAFHDITDGTNGHYKAVQGYDLATGWGSMKGQELISLLS
jgi:subtilase family serine protease